MDLCAQVWKTWSIKLAILSNSSSGWSRTFLEGVTLNFRVWIYDLFETSIKVLLENNTAQVNLQEVDVWTGNIHMQNIQGPGIAAWSIFSVIIFIVLAINKNFMTGSP